MFEPRRVLGLMALAVVLMYGLLDLLLAHPELLKMLPGVLLLFLQSVRVVVLSSFHLRLVVHLPTQPRLGDLWKSLWLCLHFQVAVQLVVRIGKVLVGN